MMNRALILILFSFFSFSIFAQDIEYSRKIIDSLSSKNYSGRGVVNNGELKSANFIANEFKRHGLKQFNSSFFQKFNYPINTFPGKMEITLDEIPLIAGEDFLVNPSSGGVYGTFKLVWYNDENIPTKKQLKKLVAVNFFTDKIIVIDSENKEDEIISMLQLNLFGAAGIINIEENKLTHGLSSSHHDYVLITIKRESISRLNKSITIAIEQEFVRDYQSQNVIGFVEGTQHPDSFITLSAHYDHLGMMGGKVYFPGANDNASGVSMLLNLVYHYSHKEPPTKTMVFIAFGAEEAGLIGSKYFVENPTIPLDKINFVFNMDLMGTGNDGATIVNGNVYKNHFEKLVSINSKNDYLPQIKKRGKAANSDHYWFSENGVPSFFIYLMGGVKAYHDIEDISKTLPLTKFEDSFRLIRDFIDDL